MATAQSKNTKPEIAVRKRLHELGFRFRLHQKIGNVRPDIILKSYNTCIFVHGCFWHRHENCSLSSSPKSNEEFWQKKFEANIRRDQRNLVQLASQGWNVGIVWECFIRAGLLHLEKFAEITDGEKLWQMSALNGQGFSLNY